MYKHTPTHINHRYRYVHMYMHTFNMYINDCTRYCTILYVLYPRQSIMSTGSDSK